MPEKNYNASTLIRLVLLLVTFIVTGCQQKKLDIRGKVVDEASGIALPNRKFVIQALEKRNEKFIIVSIDEFSSDSAGTFHYRIKRLKDIWLYDISFIGDTSYAFASQRLGLTDIRKNGRHLIFNLNRLADFIMTIERKSKTPAIDTLYLSWECDGVDGRKLYPYKIENYVVNEGGNSRNVEFRWIGGQVQSAIKTKVIADKKTIVLWELFRSGVNKRFSDTIFCSRNRLNYSNFTY
jgi:hypothetical protein